MCKVITIKDHPKKIKTYLISYKDHIQKYNLKYIISAGGREFEVGNYYSHSGTLQQGVYRGYALGTYLRRL